MRVTGGDCRGVPLVAPKGLATRPTTDRVREAIFSILASMQADLARVLDLYAGSGALAIEALSRGADEADLVERASAACAAIRQNLTRTKLAAQATLHCQAVASVLPRLTRPYSVIFLDPPYTDLSISETLLMLGASSLVAPQTTIVLEHAARTPPPARIGTMALHSDRRYGDTGVAFYRG